MTDDATRNYVEGMMQERLIRKGTIAHALVRLLYLPIDAEDDGAVGLTLCDHLFDIGVCVVNWDDVTCRSCLRIGTERWAEAKEMFE